MRRRLIFALAAVVAVVIVILLALPSLIDIDKYRPRIQAEAQEKLGRPVTLGKLTLHVFPLSVGIAGVTIGQAPGFPSQPPLATASDVSASAGFWSLVRGEPQIKSLELTRPQIELIRNSDGIWNYSSATAPAPAQSAAPPAPSPSAKQPATTGPTQFTLDKLTITDGQIAVTDLKTKQPRAVYDHIDAKLTDFAPGQPFHLNLDAHLPGQGKQLLSLDAKVGPLQTGNAAAAPIDGHLSLEEASLASLGHFFSGAIPNNTDAVMSGKADLKSEGTSISCKGDLTLKQVVIRGSKMGNPIQANYDLAMTRPQNVVQIKSGELKLGTIPVSLSGTIDAGATPSNLNVRLNTQGASLADLSHLAGAFGVSLSPGTQVKGSLNADVTAKGPMSDPQFLGSLLLKNLDIAGGSANVHAPDLNMQLHGGATITASSITAQDIVLNNVRAEAKLRNGVIQLAPLTADLFGGKESGTWTLDTRPATPLCSVNGKLTGVDTNKLLSATSSLKNTLYGSLAADGNLSFALTSSANLARTLNGTLGFNVTNGELKNVNILKALSMVGKFTGSAAAQSQSGTPLKRLSGNLAIRNGVANTNDLIATLNEGSLSAKGAVNLADQGVNMHMTAVLTNGISQQVGGSKIGGYLNSALANNKGELVMPVLVTGNLSNPTFTPDVNAIAEMKLKNLLPTSGDPGKLSSGIIGSVLGNKAGGLSGVLGAIQGKQPAGDQKKPQNAIDSILGSFGKKKKQ
jgi:AsmA protein